MHNSSISDGENVYRFKCGNAHIGVYPSTDEAGKGAAQRAARVITRAVQEHGQARIVVATGNSQLPLVEALLKTDLDWKAVYVFHMDEYVGIDADHPSSFRYWVRTRIEETVHPKMVYYLAGDATNLEAEIQRYSELLSVAPIDVAFVGFGENGHIAFNDPSVADFEDHAVVKRVTLDEACRKQQAGEGHFPTIESVPRQAVTITCTGLFCADAWACCVPELRKAQAVRDALEGSISVSCPASIVRKHPNAHVYLDSDSASMLSTVARLS